MFKLPFGQDDPIHLIGISGAEGSAVASFLIGQGFTNLIGHDACDENDFKESFWRFHDWMSEEEKESAFVKLRKGIPQWRFGEKYLEGIEIPPSPLMKGGRPEVLFVPQSWFRYEVNEPLKKFFEPNLRVREEYRDRIWSMTKLYVELFPGRVIGVTGSNGKSTTTAMIAEILQWSVVSGQWSVENRKQKHKDPSPVYQIPNTKYRLFWGGNDRKNPQPLNDIEEAGSADILLLEMSDRQLSLGLGKSPHVAVLTNVTPNHHLDDHGTFEAYARVKEEIVRYQTEGDTAILNWNNEASLAARDVTMADVVFFDVNPEDRPVPEGFVGSRREGEELVFYGLEGKRSVVAHAQDIVVPGVHNIENALAAIAAVQSFGVRSEAIREALRNFHGLDHRLELVAEKNGVRYINDSSSTDASNVVTTVRTLLEIQNQNNVSATATADIEDKVAPRPSSPQKSSGLRPPPLQKEEGEEMPARPKSSVTDVGGEMRGTTKENLLQRAKSMRRSPTESEARLWTLLRNRRLEGYKFRRQQPIGAYIVDFVCLEKKVIVEADGSQHASENLERYDAERTRFLDAQGFYVLRFWNNEILENPEGVWDVILRALETSSSETPHPRITSRAGSTLSLLGRGKMPGPSPYPLPSGERKNTLILIAGGYRKHPVLGEFLPVAKAVKGERVKHVFLIGSVREIFEKELLDGGMERGKITLCPNLEEAFRLAQKIAVSGDTIALTPGCESFGEFRDYRERGEKFRALVQQGSI